MTFLTPLRKILFNRNQFFVLTILYLALFAIFLFLLFIKSFEKRYFDGLKSIYPTLYIHIHKKRQVLPVGVRAVEEIFEPLWGEFKIAATKESQLFYIKNSALRSFDSLEPPLVVKEHFASHKKQLFVSQKSYEYLQQLIKDDTVYLVDLQNRVIPFSLVAIDISDEANWFLLANKYAKKHFAKSQFDKLVFYSDTLNETALTTLLEEGIKQPIHNWSEHISLESRAMRTIMILLFIIVVSVILIVTFNSIVIIAKVIIDDMRNFTEFAIFYGMKPSLLGFIYLGMITSIIALLLYSSYLLALYVDAGIVARMWSMEVVEISLLLPLLGSFFGVALFIMLFIKESTQIHPRKGLCV